MLQVCGLGCRGKSNGIYQMIHELRDPNEGKLERESTTLTPNGFVTRSEVAAGGTPLFC